MGGTPGVVLSPSGCGFPPRERRARGQGSPGLHSGRARAAARLPGAAAWCSPGGFLPSPPAPAAGGGKGRIRPAHLAGARLTRARTHRRARPQRRVQRPPNAGGCAGLAGRRAGAVKRAYGSPRAGGRALGLASQSPAPRAPGLPGCDLDANGGICGDFSLVLHSDPSGWRRERSFPAALRGLCLGR